jgi:hypothetical protein
MKNISFKTLYVHLYSAYILQYFDKLTKLLSCYLFLKNYDVWLIQVSEVFMKTEEYY